jgi:GNAT superfamily N-acetyltransferase
VTELSDLIVRWQRGWGVARGLPAADHVDGGLRVQCLQPGRDVEYVALDPAALDRLAAQVLREDAITWLTVPTGEPDRAAARLEAAGLLLLKRSELMMTVDLHAQPRRAPAPPYRIETVIVGSVITVTVRSEAGEAAASGAMGLTGADAIADRIETAAAHRRRGLGGAVMSALAQAAIDRGARRGTLIASADGRRLYTALGWQPAVDVLIATTA